MKADSLSKRLAALEDGDGRDTVTFAYQWLNDDGTPASKRIERQVPRSRIKLMTTVDDDQYYTK